jgi:hypothetical protein
MCIQNRYTPPQLSVKIWMTMKFPRILYVHKQIWGKDADQVIYGEGGKKNDDEQRCPICNSRIDEFGYCGCGGKLGVS